MLRWIVGSSLKFPFIVAAIAAGLMAFGFVKLREMPVDVFPEFAPPRVEIQTPCLGLSAAEVEALVTVPLEEALNGVPGRDVIRSKSVPQLSSIELIFKQGTDLLRARQVVQEQVAVVTPTLPNWASPPSMMPPVSATSRVMKIGLSSKTMPLMNMSMIAYWTIRWRLMKVPGVANVVIWGDRWKQIQVQADPRRMLAHQVTLDHLMTDTSEALDFGLLKYSDAAKSRVGGFIETPNQRFLVHHILPIVGPAGLAQVTISGRRNADGQGFAVFGRVSAGMDVVKKIWMMPAEKQRLTTPVKILKAYRK